MPGMSGCANFTSMCSAAGTTFRGLCGYEAAGKAAASSGTEEYVLTALPPSMRMYLHQGVKEYLLFRSWVPRSDVAYVFSCAAVALLAVTLVGFCGAWAWAFDLASHFRGSWLVAAAVGVVLAARRPRSLACGCSALAVVINAWALAPFWLPGPAAPARRGVSSVTTPSARAERTSISYKAWRRSTWAV
jgi:hypothetical protein